MAFLPHWAASPLLKLPLGQPFRRSRVAGKKGRSLSPPLHGFSAAETTIGRSTLGEASRWGRKTGLAPAFLPCHPASPKGLA